MSVIDVIQAKDDPNGPLIPITREQVKEFRRLLRQHYAGRGGDPSRLSRSNGFFIEGRKAVALLDEAGFDYGRELDPTERYWFVVFCSRALRRLRRNPRHAPKYVEVY